MINTIIPMLKSFGQREGKCRLDAKVTFKVDKGISVDGYRLEIDKSGIAVTVSELGGNGAFYAEKTLEMMGHEWGYYPCCVLSDAPKCKYRAVLLDTGRYFYPVSDIKKVIDDASNLKFNVLHWHLSEDQGWRAEIEAYPGLTAVGSKRRSTNGFPIPCRGFYTKDEMRDVVAYAHARHMIVVPEIDVPGHTSAAIASYNFLSCFGRKIKVANHFGVKHDVLCLGKESTYEFLYKVFTELMEIFNDGYFHLGADEVVTKRWELCPDCQKVIKTQNLANESALQTAFLNRLNREFFAKRGVKPIIWACEGAVEGLDRDFVLMQHGGGKSCELERSVNLGYDVIAADSDFFYLDFPHSITPLKKTYEGGSLFCTEKNDAVKSPNFIENASIIPLNCAEIADSGKVKKAIKKGEILGGTLSIWTEYIPRMTTLEKRVFPRILAGAEAFWSSYRAEEYENFVERAKLFEAEYGKGRNFTSVKYAQKSKGFLPKLDKLWWARRPIHWEGATNLFVDARARRQAKKYCKIHK